MLRRGAVGKAELDDAVVQAAREGDSAAFRSVYRALAPSVLAYLRAKGVVDPEAVTSEVFIALLPKLRRVSGGAVGLRKLAFSIAHARMVDDYRQRARTPVTAEYQVEDDPRRVASAEEAAEATLGTERALAVLAGLPPDQREVLTLRFVADLAIDQVAAIMHRSEGAVKQLQRRGLLAVRAAVEAAQVTQ
jgi:RNA polymerase sigma-70 factor (ECF subfamily)